MKARRKTDRRNLRPISHSLIVRYDYDARRWVHSAGIVVTPREATVLEALAKGHGPAEMARACGVQTGTFYAAQARLKQYFGIRAKSAKGQRELLQIAMDLYGSS